MGVQISVQDPPDFETPDDSEAFRDLEEAFLEEGEWKGLVSLYFDCVDEFDDEFIELPRLADHLESLVEELDEDDEISRVCLSLGDLYVGELGNAQAAKQAYRTAFVHDTSNTRSLEKARDIYRREQNDELILKLYELEEQVAATDEEEALVLTRRAQAHGEYREEFDRAIELLERACEVDEENELAERTLEIYREGRRLDDAVEEMIRLAGDAGSRGDQSMAGRLFYRSAWLEWFREGGLRDRARAIAERAVDAAPEVGRVEAFYEEISETGDAAEIDAVELSDYPPELTAGGGEGGDSSEEGAIGEESEFEAAETVQGRPGAGLSSDAEESDVRGQTMRGRPGVQGETAEGPGTEGAEGEESTDGRESVPEGGYEEALEAWRGDPGDLAAFEVVRDRLRAEEEWEELAEKLEETVKYLRKEEGEAELMADLARIYWRRLDDFEEAEHYYKRLKLLDNEHPDVAEFYEDYYERNEQWRRLFSHLKSRVEEAEDPDERIRFVRRRAEVAERNMGRPEKAIDVWKQCLRETDERRARVELERLYEEHGKWEGLVDFLKDEVSRLEDEGESTAGRRIELLTRMVDLYEHELDRPLMAMNSLRKIVELEPDNEGAFERLRDMMEESRRWNDLIELLAERAEQYRRSGADGRAADTYAEMADIFEEELSRGTRAAEALERAVEAAPERGDLRRRLAAMYESQREFEALYDLRVEELSQREGADRLQRLYDLLELAREQLRDEERTVRILEEIAEQDPGSLEVLEDLEELYRSREDWADLRDVLRRKAELLTDPGRRLGALEEAASVQERELGGGDGAVELWEAILEEDPEHEEAVERLGSLYVDRGAFDRLEDLYRDRGRYERLHEVLSAAGSEFEEVGVRREVYRRAAEVASEVLGDVGRTIASLEDLLEISDRRGDVARELAECFRETGEIDREIDATKVVLESVEETGERRRVVEKLSRLEEKREAYGDALSWQIEAIELEPDRSDALDRAERLAGEAGAYATLVELLGVIVDQLDDEDLEVGYWRRIGRLEADELGRVEDAVAHLERVREAHPEDLGALERLADLYEQTGRYEELEDLLSRLLDRKRDRSVPEEELVETMYRAAEVRRQKLDDPEGSREMFEAILEVEPDHRRSVEGLAAHFRRREQWSEAAEWFERELSLLTTDEIDRRLEVQYRLAELYRRHLGEYSEALHYYRQILDLEPGHEGALDGAAALLEEETVARKAALLLEPIFRETGRWEKLAESLESRREVSGDEFEELEILDDLVSLYRDELRDEERAFDRAAEQFRLDPAGEHVWKRLEELAASLDRWEEVAQLYADRASEEASEAPEERWRLMRRLARIRRSELDDLEGAAEILERLRDSQLDRGPILEELESLYRRLGRDEALVEVLRARAEHATTDAPRVEQLREVAHLYEDRLGDAPAAIDTYREILEVDSTDSVAAEGLERLYRERENWVELEAFYLDRVERLYDPERRRARLLQLADLRIEQLSDLEGAEELLSDLLAEEPEDERVVEALERLDREVVEEEVDRPELRSRVAESLERVYRERRETERLIEVLEVQLDGLEDPFERIEYLEELTTLYVQRVGDRGEGFEYLREAVRLDPEDEERRDRLVTLGRQLGELDSVVETLEEALDGLDPFAAEPINRAVGEICERELGESGRAVEAYERVLEVDERDEEVLRSLEQLYESTDRVERLTDNLRDQAQLADPGRRAELLERVGELERDVLERPERATEAYRELLELEPNSRLALEALEDLYERRERWLDLADVLRRKSEVVADLDDRVRTLSKLAETYDRRVDDPEEATTVYERILEVDSTAIGALEALERLYEQNARWPDLADVLRRHLMLVEEGDAPERNDLELKLADLLRSELYEPEEATERYRAVLERAPGDERAIEGLEALLEEPGEAERVEDDLVEHYRRTGKWEELVELYERREEQIRDPEERGAYAYDRARVRARQGDGDEAFRALGEAWRLDPEHDTYRSELFELAANEERWEELGEVIRDVVPEVRDPGRRADLHMRLASLEVDELDDPVAAEEEYRELLALDPERLEAFERLDEMLVEQKRWRDLVELLEDKYEVVAEADPEEANDLLLRCARLQEERLEDPYAAVDSYERLLESEPTNEVALAELRRLYRELSRWEELADHLETMLEAASEPGRIVELNVELAELLGGELYRQHEAVERYGRILDLEIEHDGAVEALEELREANPDLRSETDPLLERAYRYRQEWERVFDILLDRAGATENPSDRIETLEQAAAIADERLEDLDRAFQVARRLFGAAPGRGDLRENVREFAGRAERWGELEELYGEVLEGSISLEGSQRAELYLERGRILESRLEDLEGAREAYRRALDVSGGGERGEDALERVLAREDDWSGLAEMYRDRAEVRSEVEAVKGWLAKLARLEEVIRYDVDAAIEAYYDIFEVDPDDEHAHSAVRRLLAYDERWYDLADRYRDEIDRAENAERSIEMKFRLAQLKEGELDDIHDAIRLYGEILDERPRHRDTLRALEGLRRDLADREGSWREHRTTIIDELSESYELPEDWRRTVDLLESRRALEEAPRGRAELLVEEAELIDEHAGDDVERVPALSRLGEAYCSVPQDEEIWEALTSFAEKLDVWPRVPAVLLEGLRTASNTDEQSALLNRLGDVYRQQLEDLESAVAAYQQAAAVDPAEETLEQLESLYTEAELWKGLVEVLEFRLDRSADSDDRTRLLERLGELHDQTLGRPAEAASYYEDLRVEHPGEKSYYDSLESIYERTGEYEQLEELLQSRLERVESSEERVRLLRRLATIQDEYLERREAAIETYEQLRETESDEGDRGRVVEALIRLYERTHRWPQLIEVLDERRGLADDPGEVNRLDFRRGHVQLEKLGDPEGAFESFRSILERDPAFEPARETMAELAGRPQTGPRAAEYLRELHRREEDWEALRELLERQLEVVGDPDRCGEMFTELSQLHEEELGNPQIAFAMLGRALRELPEKVYIRRDLDRLSAKLDNPEELVAIYEDALESDVVDPDVARDLHRRVAELAAERVDDLERAVDHARSAYDIDEYDDETLELLDRLYQQTHRWEALAEILERRLELADPDELADIRFRLGYLQEVMFENFEEALDYYRKVVEEDPAHGGVVDGLERIVEDERMRGEVAELLGPAYRKNEQWGKLVELRELQLEIVEEPGRVAELNREIADVWIEERDRPEIGFSYLGRALRADPRAADLRERFEDLARRQERIEELVSVYEELLESLADPAHVLEFAETAADWAHRELGELERAAKLYRRVLEVEPDHETALEAGEEIARELGRDEELAEMLERRSDLVYDSDEQREVLVELGEVATALERYEQAADAYRQALLLDESDTEVMRRQIGLYEVTEQYEELVDVLDRLSNHETDPDQLVRHHMQIGRYCREFLDQPDRAIRAYREVLAHRPDHAEALEALEELYRREERWTALEEILQSSLERAEDRGDDEEVARVCVQLGRLSYDRFGDVEPAVDWFERALEIESGHPDVIDALEEIYREEQDWDSLLELMEGQLQEIDDGARSAELLAEMGRIHLEYLDDPGEADRFVERALEVVEAHDDALEVRADVCRARENWEGLLEVYSLRLSGAESPAREIEVRERRAELHAEQRGEPEAALREYRAILELEPLHERALERAAELYREMGDSEGRYELLAHEADHVGNEDREVALCLEMAELASEEIGDPERRIEALERADESRPGDLEIIEPLVEAYLDAGRTEAAEPLLREVIELLEEEGREEETARFRHLRGNLYEERGELERAVQAYEGVVETDDTFIPGLLSLGKLAYRMEDWEKANQTFEKLLLHQMKLESDEQKIEVYYHLGLIRRELGDPRRAKDMFKRALSIDPNHAPSQEEIEALEV